MAAVYDPCGNRSSLRTCKSVTRTESSFPHASNTSYTRERERERVHIYIYGLNAFVRSPDFGGRGRPGRMIRLSTSRRVRARSFRLRICRARAAHNKSSRGLFEAADKGLARDIFACLHAAFQSSEEQCSVRYGWEVYNVYAMCDFDKAKL